MQQEENSSVFGRLFGLLTTAKAVYIIIFVGIIVFFNGLFNGFVMDDGITIVGNLPVHSIANILTFFTSGTFYNGNYQHLVGNVYRPVTLTLLSFIYTFFGAGPFWFHLFQLFFHISNAIILFLIFKHFFKKPLAFILSLIFLVHPINSEAVFYAASMSDVLFFFFGILALWFILNYKSDKELVLSGVFLFLSLLSKETGLLFIFIAFVYVFLFARKLLLPFILSICFAILPVYLLLKAIAVGIFTSSLSGPIDKASLIQRMINIPAIFFLYIKNFIFPLNLSSSYQFVYKQITFEHFFLPLFVDILLIFTFSSFAFLLYKKYPKKYFNIYVFFAAWFTLGILLHLQILPLDVTAADRWFYLPIAGIIGMLGVLVEVLLLAKMKKELIMLLFGIIVLVLSARTIIRSFDWRDDFTLATHDIKISRDSYDIESRVAYGLMKQGRSKEALINAQISVNLYPYLTNYENLGLICLSLGMYSKAREAYIKASTFGDFYITDESLALIGVASRENPKEYIDFTKHALQKYPRDPILWLSLAILEYQNGNKDGAKLAITNAYTLSQDSVTSEYYSKIINGLPLDSKFPLYKYY